MVYTEELNIVTIDFSLVFCTKNDIVAFDISADLTELGRTPVAVVCAGVKSILDIPKTLEVLETQGVTVTTFGKDKTFPAFYTPDSGFKVSDLKSSSKTKSIIESLSCR